MTAINNYTAAENNFTVWLADWRNNTGITEQSENQFDLGVDLRYGVSSNAIVNATVNPDFGQVEADPSVLNLGAFETFYDEKRPFFSEGASWQLQRFEGTLYNMSKGQATRGIPIIMHCYIMVSNNDKNILVPNEQIKY